MPLNDVDIISNSSSEYLDLAQLDMVLIRRIFSRIKVFFISSYFKHVDNIMFVLLLYCLFLYYFSDKSSDKNCLFGRDYSDIIIDPPYVPDSDENIQNDSASNCNVIIPVSKYGKFRQ